MGAFHGVVPMRLKTMLWLLVLAALTLYSLLVYNWWIEGNINFEQQRVDQENENIIPRH
jgi:hypothetical protein